MGFTRGCGHAVPIHIGAEVGRDAGEEDSDVSGCKLGKQVTDGPGGGEVDVVMALASTTNQRTGAGAWSTRAHTSSMKRGVVGIEQVRTEAVDHQAWLGLLARSDRDRLPGSSGTGRKHHRMRAIAVADVPEEGEGDCEQDTLFDADGHDGAGGWRRRE